MRLTSTSSGASEPTASPWKSFPEVASSTFRYATAFFFSSSAYCSPHSVEPVSAYSSPSQLQMTSVRLGRMPCFRSCAQIARQFQHRGGAARRIDAAKNPRVAMIAENHPLVGRFAAANARFGNVVGLDARIHVHFHMNATRVFRRGDI